MEKADLWQTTERWRGGKGVRPEPPASRGTQ